MNCEKCLKKVKFKELFYNDEYAMLCETCFMLLDETNDKEIIELQRVYSKEITK